MAHSTILPCAMTIPSRNIFVNYAPVGTPHSPIPTPSPPLGYHALNSSAAIHTQIPSGVPLGHNNSVGYVPTPSQVLYGGSYPPLHGGSGPSGSNPIGSTHHLFTSGYHIPAGGKSYAGGQPQFGVHTQIGVPPPYGGHSQVGTYNSQSRPNRSNLLAHLWNLQDNPQPFGGQPSQTNVLVPLNYGQPYPGSLNPT